MHLHRWFHALLCLPLPLSFSNIQSFNTALMGTTPLFQIDTILAAPEIALLPKSSEVYKLIRQCVGDCVESTRVCWQWTTFREKMQLWGDDVFLQALPEVINTLVPSTKTQQDFSIGFWILEENKLYVPQKIMILTCFVHHDKLNDWRQHLWSLNTIGRTKKLNIGHEQTTPWSHDLDFHILH